MPEQLQSAGGKGIDVGGGVVVYIMALDTHDNLLTTVQVCALTLVWE